MSDATTPRLKVSREGVVLIKSFEGFRPHAVRADEGRWVIGYGHSASAREGLTVGEQDAELLLQYDLLPVVRALNERAPAGLNQHQFDALASFAISVGVERFLASDVLQRLNEGDARQAADALIGWPETSPDARLRRRAAERALFVADPGAAVTLADLLAAPLSAEAPATEPAEAQPGPVGARAAAVAALLGETPETLTAPLEAPEPDRDPAGDTAAPAPDVRHDRQPATAFGASHLQRYSPYAATVIGPLPGFGPLTPSAAAVEQPASDPVVDAGPASPAQAEVPAPALEPVEPAPVIPLVSPAPGPSPFPDLDQPLTLTPLTDADLIAVERPAPPEEGSEVSPAVDPPVMFEDEPTAPVLRHEVEPEQPRRFDWADTGAFLIMGGVGLAACAASAAAFRLSVEQPSPMGETSVIAWALALIGVICVGVSSWNLYVRWGKPD